ncbi:MAG: hypothetical protein P4L16_01675 [Chlamydiales bacterium]|nr:hypothetical protein [Chlamydiales bacterium]
MKKSGKIKHERKSTPKKNKKTPLKRKNLKKASGGSLLTDVEGLFDIGEGVSTIASGGSLGSTSSTTTNTKSFTNDFDNINATLNF